MNNAEKIKQCELASLCYNQATQIYETQSVSEKMQIVKKEKFIFVVYILTFIVLAMTLVLFQPLSDESELLSNPPDEHARYLVPLYICEHGTIPTGLEEEVRIPSYGFSYALYNVFPYIIQGYVMRLVRFLGGGDLALLYSARMVNVVFGVLMATVVYLLSKRLFRDRRFQWLFCVAVTFMPQSLFLHTYVNSDSCCMLSTAMMVYGLVKCYRDGISRSSNLWMSGGIILCALSYYNAYGYVLSCILLFVAYFLRKEEGRWTYDYKGMLKHGILISSLVLIGIGWWFIRSYIVLDGDLLGLATREKLAEQYAIESVNPLYMQTYQNTGYSLGEMIRERDTLERAFASFVAAYGSVSIMSRMGIYHLYKVFFGLGVVGCVYRVMQRQWGTGQKRLSWREWFFHANMIFCAIMPLVLMLYYSYTTDYQDQGRYVMPALIPLMYYTVSGIEKLLSLRGGKIVLPRWGVNVGVVIVLCLIMGSVVDMIFFRAMPVYLQIGSVL